MSSAVVSTSAASSRHFVLDEESALEVGSASLGAGEDGCPHMAFRSLQESSLTHVLQSRINNQKTTIPLTPASRLEIHPAPEMVSSGIVALDALIGGLPRGCLTEICGPASSGRTTVLLAALAAATGRGEFCALVDAGDALDPQSAAAAGVELERLLWVRCDDSSPQRHPSTSLRAGSGTEKEKEKQHQISKNRNGRKTNQAENRLEQVLRATDLLLESGGFGLIALDLADMPLEAARRIPLTTWFRFRRAIEHTPTILLTIEQQPIAGSCSSLLLQLGGPGTQHPEPGTQYPVPGTQYPVLSSRPSHSHLLTGLEITVELIRSRHDRKPAHSVAFQTRTAWAG
jgi:hypothetical protein